MVLRIGCIVEGHGERESVPILLRRIASIVNPGLTLEIPQPIRVPKSKLTKPGELERAVELAARKIDGRGSIFVIVDADADCPADLGPSLAARANSARGDLYTAVVVAKKEFEGWFLASAESLRGHRGLSDALQPPDDPESIGDAKGWLAVRMTVGGSYSSTLDQPALTSIFDLTAARAADSFDKCYREAIQLMTGPGFNA